MKPKRKSPSLKWELIGIVLICFVLPVFVFAASTVALMTENSERQTTQTVTYNFDSAVRGAQSNLQNVIAASRTASRDPAVRNAYRNYVKNADKVALYDDVQGFLARQYSYNPNILGTMLFFMDDPYPYEDGYTKIYFVTNGSRGSFPDMATVYRAEVHPLVLELSEEIDTDIRFLVHGENLYMVRNIMDSNYRPYAMIVMLLDPSSIFSSLPNMAWENGSSVTLDGEEIVVSGEGAAPPAGAAVSANTRYIRSGDDYTIWKRSKMETHDITYVSDLSNLPAIAQAPSFYYIIIFALGLTVVLMVLFILFFYRSITKPVTALVNASEKVQGGELGYQMEANLKSGEFNSLAASFNNMSARLETMFEKSRQEQMALQDARIDALQSQINPHFLNNTLEIINWESRMAGATHVSAMIEALSTLLSGAMARDGNTMVRVSEELAYLDSYLFIISARLGKRLAVAKEIDKKLLTQKVPRLIMQPLVENAVDHAILPRQHGTITLRVYREDECLVLEVENDGELSAKDAAAVGRLLAETPEESQTKGKLGVRNVNARVKLIYGAGSGLSIVSENGKTIARVKLPMEYEC